MKRTGPLSGVRIIDLSTMLAGPWCADLLGDQGADVIKVEAPHRGDHTRKMGHDSGGVSAMFANINRSKRSVEIDLKSAAGREVLLDLVGGADVVIQNFRPGVADRLGIGYDCARIANPGVVYLSLSGFGERGPYAQARAYDPVLQALSGLASIQAGSDDAHPRLIRTVLPDKLTAISAAQAVTAALFARQETGVGQHVRLSMLDAVVAFLWASDMEDQTWIDRPLSTQTPASERDLIYATRSGAMTVAVMTDAEWRGLCLALARPEWLQDPRFATPAGRQEHIDERLALTQEALLERPAAEWLEILARHDVPAAPALSRNELIEHPQVGASDLLVESEHPAGGRIRQARVAARFEGTPVQAPPGAPALGEHTDAVLAEIGCTRAQIAELRAHGAIGPQRTPRPAPEPIDIEQELEALVSRTRDSSYGVS